MDLFQSYEGEFDDLVNGIRKKISEAIGTSGEEKRNTIRAAELEITEAIETLEAMKLGARTLPASHKAAAQSKIEGHERTLQELKTDLKKAEISFGSYGADRDKLFSSSGSDISVSSTDQRTRLLSADELASAAADNVDRANMTMDENLDIAVSALGTLHEQGETITRHRTKLQGIVDGLGTANRTMRVMFRRALTNKFILAGIALLILATIVVIIVIKFALN